MSPDDKVKGSNPHRDTVCWRIKVASPQKTSRQRKVVFFGPGIYDYEVINV